MREISYVAGTGWWACTWRRKWETQPDGSLGVVSYSDWSPVVMFRIAEQEDWFACDPILVENGSKMVAPGLLIADDRETGFRLEHSWPEKPPRLRDRIIEAES